MLAENYDFLIGGDQDRHTIDLAVLDTDLAVLDTRASPVRAHLAEAGDGPG
ncbi:MAG: hypothetical protein ABI301_01745 [Jatrophihabitantaceae bacterium]